MSDPAKRLNDALQRWNAADDQLRAAVEDFQRAIGNAETEPGEAAEAGADIRQHLAVERYTTPSAIMNLLKQITE